MKKFAACIILLSLFSCATTENIDKKYTNVRLEMTLINGEIVTEDHFVPSSYSIFVRTKNNKSWVVIKTNNCDDCIPTIIKNNKEIVIGNKVIATSKRKVSQYDRAIVSNRKGKMSNDNSIVSQK